ncbi:MAG: YitT family protein [Deltaproteobacteria bacterium]|nr:YitT family protein [Deltaproteobacteria bacterium]MBW2032178.1 YitT family protein [Deltaproteobacteria bacterium]MBW2113820.1 YitT family protein [Deltaproteobacteria bacterium]MBW2358631.1 YitT family protein [Deltaproteobacteria bacterium]
MSAWSWKYTAESAIHVVWNLGLMSLGSALCAVAINGILIPQQFYGAGFSGVSLVIHYLVPTLPVAALYFVLNVPIFALGWMYVGRRFFLYSIAGMLIFTSALAWVHVSLPIHDKILSALMAGIIIGVGSGVILRSLGSSGGLDILSVILLKRFSIRLGTTILAFNSLILGAGAILFSLDRALYTLIFIFVSSYVVNLVVTGLSQRKAVFIISPQWEEISHEIMDKIQRGVTIIGGRGGYTGRDERILYTVITFRELSQLKQLIRGIDSDAFVVVTDTLEVIGHRIGNQPHW